MIATLSGSTEIPLMETMWPSNLPQVVANSDFAAFMDIPYSLHWSKHFFKELG